MKATPIWKRTRDTKKVTARGWSHRKLVSKESKASKANINGAYTMIDGSEEEGDLNKFIDKWAGRFSQWPGGGNGREAISDGDNVIARSLARRQKQLTSSLRLWSISKKKIWRFSSYSRWKPASVQRRGYRPGQFRLLRDGNVACATERTNMISSIFPPIIFLNVVLTGKGYRLSNR